jgi:hypothetical protein
MIDDLGEVAQLASEFISSLDNLPQEVQHMIKEIEHKDVKVQGKLSSMHSKEEGERESQQLKPTLLSLHFPHRDAAEIGRSRSADEGIAVEKRESDRCGQSEDG